MADLTDLEIDARIAGAGPKKIFPAGHKLYIQVVNGRATMLMRYKSPTTGTQRMMGLGRYNHRNLEKARDDIRDAERLLEQGIDPIDRRDEAKAARVAAQVTFKQVALDGYWPASGNKRRAGYVEIHAPEWGEKHLQHWKSSMRDWVFDHIGDVAIGRLTRAHVIDVLNQRIEGDGTLWENQNPTACLVRQRIELVWNAAKADSLVSGDNPADWPSMKSLFADSSAVHTKVPRRMVAWQEVPKLYSKLRERQMIRSRALEMLILTCARSKNILAARWDEFDLGTATWTVAAEHMKNNKQWRCPLSAPAIDLLRSMPRTGELVFPGTKPGKSMAHDRLDKELKAAGYTDNVHGMRASFRTWAQENGQDFLACEFQLAHIEGSASVLAYARSDLLEQRRALVECWAQHVVGAIEPTNVVRLHARAATA